MEAALSQRQKDMFSLQQVQSQLEEQRLRLQIEHQRQLSQQDDANQKLLQRELEAAASQYRQQQSITLEAHRDELRRLMSQSRDTVTELQHKVSEMETSERAHRLRADQIDLRCQELQMKFEQAKHSIDAADRVIEELRSTIERQVGQIKERDEQLSRYSRDSLETHAEQAKKIADFQRQLHEASVLVDQLQSSNADLRQHNDRLQQEVARLDLAQSEAAREMQSLSSQMQRQIDEQHEKVMSSEKQSVTFLAAFFPPLTFCFDSKVVDGTRRDSVATASSQVTGGDL